MIDPSKLDISNEVTTGRLLLRRYQPGDRGEFLRAMQENHAHLREFMPPNRAEMRSEAAAETFFRWADEVWERREVFIYGVWEQARGVYAGEAYLANADWSVPCIEVGYFVLAAHTGQGYAVEAARALVAVAFERLGMARVELECAADNLASQRVAERCGFTLEGRLRRRHRKKSGEVVDRLWFGLLREEWSGGE